MSLSITDIIKQTLLVYGLDEWRPPDLVRLQDQVVQYQQRKWDNEHLILRQRHFDKSPSVSTPSKRTQEIINGIDALGMPLKLYEGEASGFYWTGENLDKQERFTIPQIMLKDDEGNSLEFDIEEFDLEEPAEPFVNLVKSLHLCRIVPDKILPDSCNPSHYYHLKIGKSNSQLFGFRPTCELSSKTKAN